MNDEEETEEDEMDEDEDMDIGDHEEGEDDEEEYEDEEEEDEEDDEEQTNGIKSALNGYAKDVARNSRGLYPRCVGWNGKLIRPWTQATRRRPPPNFSRPQARRRPCIPFVALLIA